MPFVNAPDTLDALTADGNARGYITVADNSKYYPGATAWLISNAVGSTEYVITDLVGSDKIGLRLVVARDGGARYGRTPVTQWKVSEGAKIAQAASTVSVEWTHQKLAKP